VSDLRSQNNFSMMYGGGFDAVLGDMVSMAVLSLLNVL
jgi:hypothetical protein